MQKKNGAKANITNAAPAYSSTTMTPAPPIAKILAELEKHNVKFGKNERIDAAFLETVRYGDRATAANQTMDGSLFDRDFRIRVFLPLESRQF